jgi:guanylate kinase
VKGGLNLKEMYGSNVLSIFVMPPSIEELESRLKKRKTESIEKINQRLSKAKKEIRFSSKFDYVVINDDIKAAKKQVHQIASKFLDS